MTLCPRCLNVIPPMPTEFAAFATLCECGELDIARLQREFGRGIYSEEDIKSALVAGRKITPREVERVMQ